MIALSRLADLGSGVVTFQPVSSTRSSRDPGLLHPGRLAVLRRQPVCHRTAFTHRELHRSGVTGPNLKRRFLREATTPALACGCEVLSVDYRLAPEHPHPAALEDASTVYRHLVSQGTDPASVILAGDSAGGGLVAALLLALRDAGDRMPAGALLLSPWLDLTVSSDSITALAADDPILTADSLATSAHAYAGDGLKDPLVSPVFADPAGLPPLLILTSTADILVDDSRTFAKRARAAGVQVDLDVERGLIHVWPAIDGLPEAAHALDRISAWIRETQPVGAT